MSCDDIRNMLDEYITDELDATDRELVEGHLNECEACRKECELIKAQKAELVTLAEPLPSNFENKLVKKIRRYRLAGYAARLGAGVAAAVALVCVVSLSRTTDYNEQLNNRLAEVSDSGKGTIEAVTESEAVNEDISDEMAETSASDSNEAVAEQNTNAPQAVEKQSTETADVGITDSVTAEKSDEPTILNSVSENSDSTETEEVAEESVDTSAYDTTPMPSVRASRRSVTTEGEDINITVGNSLAEVCELLNDLQTVEIIDKTENELTAEVEDMSYDELKMVLDRLDIVDEAVYIDETEPNYTIRIESR